MMREEVILVRIGDTGTPKNAIKQFLERDLGAPVVVHEVTRLDRHDGGIWRYNVKWEPAW